MNKWIAFHYTRLYLLNATTNVFTVVIKIEEDVGAYLRTV